VPRLVIIPIKHVLQHAVGVPHRNPKPLRYQTRPAVVFFDIAQEPPLLAASLGQRVRVRGLPHLVLGVAGSGFRGPGFRGVRV